MRVAWVCFAATIFLGCGSSDSSPGESTTSGGTTSGGNGGANGTQTTTNTAGAGGNAGSAGAGGTMGTGGTSGSGGSAGGGGNDAGAIDSGMPKSDAARDVVPDSPSKGRQTMRPIGMPYAKNGFWEYLPPGYGDGTKRPLLVFWHGVGENGAGTAATLPAVLVHGPPKLINLNQWPADRPFIVLSPQHPGVGDCPTATEIHDFIAFGMTNYDVDTNRVYLTGLSCGALGSSSYLGQFQGQQVVAAVLIAGDASIAYNAAGCALLNQVALWAFHGDADQTVPIGPDTTGMTNFMACPGMHKEALYDIFPGADHQRSWEITYDLSAMKDIYTWMLAQHR
jgi:predicted esterase